MKHFCSFSEAIREGAKLRPRQCFYKFFDGDDASCATGAAIEAVLGRSLTAEQLNMRQPEAFLRATRPVAQMYQYMRKQGVPPCGCETLLGGAIDVKTGAIDTEPSLYNIAVHLNNFHKWTRKEIADWLESEEEKLGFVTVVESESPRAELSFDQQLESARAGALK